MRRLVLLLALLAAAAALQMAGCGGAPKGTSSPRAAASTSLPASSATARPMSPTPSGSAPQSSPLARPSRSPSPSTGTSQVPCTVDAASRSWYYIPNGTHQRPAIPADVARLLRVYGASYSGDTGARVVYLTFDEGYENGLTGRILDELAAAGAPGAFFVTGAYVRDNPALVRRMVEEGHVVANHTGSHASLAELATRPAAFAAELRATERAFGRATGEPLARFVRPPSGEYSARSLCLARRLGYTTVFWSFAHRDWLVDDQPPAPVTLRRILAGSHDGAIYLLHAVSSSDTLALPRAIAGLRDQGYRLASLAEL